ncbi:biotin-dependent carboxyltransferase family protein [Neobacillus drentensis]|uniref:5-oxoprolinase subunit C family protein n=1 Tax=Neobacillus drentensis TaxID=220684 RepID=UPI002FFDBBB4
MNSPIFRVIKPGLQTTVQDFGRFGYQQFGVSPAGAMDSYSMQIANILVGNVREEAVLEVSFTGPSLEALSDMVVSICGGDFSPTVDGQPVQTWRSFLLKKGQVVSVGQCKQGARTYLAIAGGIDVPTVLGSKSTFLNGCMGGHEGRALKKNDTLFGFPEIRKPYKSVGSDLIPEHYKQLEVRVILGPHHQLFTAQSLRQFLSEEYRISPQSNRMGYQLNGTRLEHTNGPDIISDPIPLGGIQVPASGQPIILMADHQTTGGYTRIATVISVDISKVARAVPGTVIKFSQVSLEESQRLYVERQSLLKRLALAAK